VRRMFDPHAGAAEITRKCSPSYPKRQGPHTLVTALHVSRESSPQSPSPLPARLQSTAIAEQPEMRRSRVNRREGRMGLDAMVVVMLQGGSPKEKHGPGTSVNYPICALKSPPRMLFQSNNGSVNFSDSVSIFFFLGQRHHRVCYLAVCRRDGFAQLVDI
jgi:hypothetical protein